MEQQKVLWIIFSVTLFLVVVVVVGFIWFLPPEDDREPDIMAETAGVEAGSEVFDPIVWVREDEEIPGVSEEAKSETEIEEGDLLLVYGEAEQKPETNTSDEPQKKEIAGVRVVQPQVERVIPETAVTVQERAPARTSPVQVQTSEPQTTVKAPVKTVQASAPKTERVTHYWIQAGSFQTQSRAEQTQHQLAERGWDTRIISRDVNGQVFFRVRLGPFETKDEAGKFLDWITDIDSFESSYISEVYTTRTIN